MNNSKNINRLSLKLIIIGIIGLALLIPTSMINFLINEREIRKEEAISEVNSKWGEKQILVGPILTIPYKYLESKTIDNDKVETIEKVGYLNLLPDKLNIKGEIFPEKLQRGIYEIVSYNADLNFEGEFKISDIKDLNISEEDIKWDDAMISVTISDMRGINKDIVIKWDEKELQTVSGIVSGLDLESDLKLTGEEKEVMKSGIKAKVALKKSMSENYSYSFNVNLNGGSELNFVPAGRESNLELSSDWNNPSFRGSFLPDSRELNENGFKANWKVLEINRNFSQAWLESGSNEILGSNFGVRLLLPVNEYQKTTRSIKYAIMLIALTFLTFFFVEVMNKIRVHLIQYVLVGLALVLFFTLLLSISEHINFNFAYLISSIATILLVVLYSKTIFKNIKLSLLQGGILVVAYSFMFILIQLQDYSLLIGSVGLFVILAIVMYISRKVNWYSTDKID